LLIILIALLLVYHSYTSFLSNIIIKKKYICIHTHTHTHTRARARARACVRACMYVYISTLKFFLVYSGYVRGAHYQHYYHFIVLHKRTMTYIIALIARSPNAACMYCCACVIYIIYI